MAANGRISELPALLDHPVVTDGVEKLYRILAHHSIGIPAGMTLTAVRTSLSKRLVEQLHFAALVRPGKQVVLAARICPFGTGRAHTRGTGRRWRNWFEFRKAEQLALNSSCARTELQRCGDVHVDDEAV